MSILPIEWNGAEAGNGKDADYAEMGMGIEGGLLGRGGKAMGLGSYGLRGRFSVQMIFDFPEVGHPGLLNQEKQPCAPDKSSKSTPWSGWPASYCAFF
jgi:hypothetical protein